MNPDYTKNFKNCVAVSSTNPLIIESVARHNEEKKLKVQMEKKIPSATELKAQGRERLMSANYYPPLYWECQDDFPYELYCPVCGSACNHESKENLTMAWLGLGVDEHCWQCGAEPEHHDPFYHGRFEKWRMDFILEELNRVEAAYCSYKFMAREQIAKNREYFGTILAAIDLASHYHNPDRYRNSIKRRQSQELHIRINQLAILKHGGDREKALKEYENMSLDIDDICTIFDELESHLKLPVTYTHY